MMCEGGFDTTANVVRHTAPMKLPHALAIASLLISLVPVARAFESGDELAQVFAEKVTPRLEVPPLEQQKYADALRLILTGAAMSGMPPQFFVVVDRDPNVQAAMIYWKSPSDEYRFIGATPASTGKVGAYEHFETPTGIFEHSIGNRDFRAEGTKNAQGVRGYGKKGMRVFDFGWQQAARGWGKEGESAMRLQMHATDPDLLEPREGSPQSKGCVRIPAALDVFIDHYGILDADYEEEAAAGKTSRVLSPDRETTPWSGRYLVVVDSGREERPAWSPPRVQREADSGACREENAE
jgi:hypothetical protein